MMDPIFTNVPNSRYGGSQSTSIEIGRVRSADTIDQDRVTMGIDDNERSRHRDREALLQQIEWRSDQNIADRSFP